MAVSQPILTPFSSTTDGIVSGDPWVLVGGEFLVRDFSRDLQDRIEAAMRKLRSDIRKAAEVDVDWAPYADHIDVQFADEEIQFVLSGDEAALAQMEALEYGSPEVEPKPLLRKTILAALPGITRSLQIPVDL